MRGGSIRTGRRLLFSYKSFAEVVLLVPGGVVHLVSLVLGLV